MYNLIYSNKNCQIKLLDSVNENKRYHNTFNGNKLKSPIFIAYEENKAN